MQGEPRHLLFVGDDWAEDHHDVEIQDETGRKLAARRLPEGAAGLARLHELIAAHLDADGDPGQVVVAIETDRGLWVQALAAAGYLAKLANGRGRFVVSGGVHPHSRETLATTSAGWGTEIVEVPGRGHALTIDSGWREVADTALKFVQRFV